MKITQQITGFSDFLSRNWREVQAQVEGDVELDSEEFLRDWCQANWELLVETTVRQQVNDMTLFLEPYGDGADCNERSSRVWLPTALPTHRIVCVPRSPGATDLLTGEVLGASRAVFDHLASKSANGWHSLAPPFDCAQAMIDEQEVLLALGDTDFLVEALPI